jgi:myo-inositol 2-dehydrogenase/D-chiro-inositol 1-dehydrogenase
MTVRVGVIGAGWIGQDHIRRLTDTVTGAEVTGPRKRRPEPAPGCAPTVPS